MPKKKVNYEFIYQERQANLSPFYLFAKPWGTKVNPILGKNLNPIILIFSNRGVEYFVNHKDFRQLGKKTYQLFLSDVFYKRMNRHIDSYADKITRLAQLIERKNLKRLTDKKLVDYFQKMHRIMLNLNIWGQLLSMTEYGQNSYTTQGLMQALEKILTKKRALQTSAQVSKILSQPIRESYFRKEKLDLLKIAAKMAKRKLKIDSGEIKKDLAEHQRKFCWINFGYVGPALNVKYFQKNLKGLIKENKGKDINKIYYQEKKALKNLTEEQKRLEDELELSPLLRKRFAIVSEQTYYKEYRKEVLFWGFCACELIQVELAKRWHLPVKAFSYILPQELKKDKLGQLYSQRKEMCVYCLDNDKEYVFVGRQAEDKIKPLKKEKAKTEDIKELKGSIAYAGKVRGRVKVVMGESHLHKVKKGDILVSFSTNPQMIAVMKKAGAIVTEQGGIGSHAAIVSRELKIPCIVSVPKAAQILKDGQLVEVDAERGVVRILKK